MGNPGPAERILALAAYVKSRRGGQVTIGDITRDVPGYDAGGAPRDGHGELVAGTREWESLRKKVARDLEDLAEHWDVHVDWDEAAKSYFLQPSFFTTQERAALVAAAAAVDVEGPGPERLGDVGTAVDDAYARVIVRVPELVAALRGAIASRTPVRFRHGGRERLLEPYALGQWANRWYVAGWSPEAAAARRYRLDRIELPPEGEPIAAVGPVMSYEIPDWFRADLAFDMDPNSWGRDPVLEARIRVDADHAPAFSRDVGGQVVETEDAPTVVALTVRHHQWTRDRLLAYRGHVRVLEPAELIRLLREHLAAIAGTN